MLATGTRASKIFNGDICLFNLHDIKALLELSLTKMQLIRSKIKQINKKQQIITSQMRKKSAIKMGLK